MTEYTDAYWTSRDGLNLHYRDYPGRADRPPVVCLPGLTRNARDFEPLARRLSGEWRVICPEMRGRGDSDYAKDSASYNPLQYVDDIGLLFETAGIDRFVAIGTSLGGLMTMIMALTMPGRIAGAVLNDIGPFIDPVGMTRIKDYVGSGRSFPTWMHAARGLEESQSIAYPDYQISDWLTMAKQLMVLSSNDRVVFDYDMKIAEPLATLDVHAPPKGDPWAGIDALAGRPLLFIRGELSDILSLATFAEMQRRLPEADAVTIARIGHPPTLDEPEAQAAIARFLAKVG